MITDKYTKTAWTIIAVGLFVISEIGFKTFQSTGSKGHAYMRNKKMRTGIKTKITGFHQDEYEHWVADLSCGHSRHFRHDPPWQQREWVTSPQGRKTYIGFELDCNTCGSPDVEKRERMKKNLFY